VLLAGREIVLDCSGAMWLPEERLLVVSDLHFEKGSHFARRGQFLPPYDTRATLDGLERLMRLCRPKTVLSLGDAFHDREAEGRMDERDAARLERLCGAAEWIWILGNHDPLPPKRFRGTAHETAEIAGLLFVHEPNDAEGWQVAGHLHPCAIAEKNGRGVRRPAFVTDGERMVMPAFGAFTGGLNVLDKAFAPVFPASFQAHLCGKSRVYAVPTRSLRPDTPPPSWVR
jgi:DNA ligase-associated metallophosphoesterase